MDSSTWWFDGWWPLLRTVVVGAAGYVSLIAILRISGKRTLSKMNAFDLVVTVAIGSVLASTLGTTPLARGLAGFGVLIGLQTLVAWASSRSAKVRGVVSASPTLLLYRGEVLDAALRRERVSRTQLEAAVRSAGRGRLDDAEAVVLECDGSLTVIGRSASGPATALDEVAGAPR